MDEGRQFWVGVWRPESEVGSYMWLGPIATQHAATGLAAAIATATDGAVRTDVASAQPEEVLATH